MVLRARDVFNLDDLARQECSDAVRYIKNCHNKLWPPLSSTARELERDVSVALCQHIFVPLSRTNEVFLEQSCRKHLSTLGPRGSRIRTAHIGIGSPHTWHGSPDMRVRGMSVLTTKKYEVEVSDDDNEVSGDNDLSDGMTTAIETKVCSKVTNLPQLVATSVVSSFTEHCLHAVTATPTILIDMEKVITCFNESQHDILLILCPVRLGQNGHISAPALLLLWLTLNHRHFLQELPQHDNLRSTIRCKLSDNGYLPYFANLKSKDVDWSSQHRCTETFEDFFSGIRDWKMPPKEKRPRK